MTSAPAVIPTSPASRPLTIIVRSGLPPIVQEAAVAVTAPAAAARFVVTSTRLTAPASAERTEPPLKPNHPSHRRKAPMTTSGMLWPRIGFTRPPAYFPWRGPRRITPASAPQPPTEWTRVDPAKSWKGTGRVSRKPPPHFHIPAMG